MIPKRPPPAKKTRSEEQIASFSIDFSDIFASSTESGSTPRFLSTVRSSFSKQILIRLSPKLSSTHDTISIFNLKFLPSKRDLNNQTLIFYIYKSNLSIFFDVFLIFYHPHFHYKWRIDDEVVQNAQIVKLTNKKIFFNRSWQIKNSVVYLVISLKWET